MTVQSLPLQKLGLNRPPIVTAIVFAVTATANALQFLIPGMLDALQRTPAGLHGEWWRTLTSLFVQDGGLAGTVFNLAFLLVIGALAEQILDTPRWLICYFGAGLVGELVGYAWQPHGGGNSIAICGLAGALAVALWLEDARVPKLAPMVLLYWCGGLLGTLFWPGLVLCVVGGVLVQLAMQRGRSVGRPVAVAVAAAAVILAAATNIHGAALLAGIAIAALMAVAHRMALSPAAPRTSQVSSRTAGNTSAPSRR